MPIKKLRGFTKFYFCIIYLIVIGILFVSAYNLYNSDKKDVSWEKVTSTDRRTSLTISKMSEAFAKIDKKQIHFVIVMDKDKVYHSYLIAIPKKDYKKYKEMIDYSYNRTKDKVKPITVYGYPQIINDELKQLTLENYKKFLPNDNSIKLTKKNFNKYITNTYLDTTITKMEKTNYMVIVLLVLIVILVILLLFTLIDRDKTKNKELKKDIKKNKDDDIEVI